VSCDDFEQPAKPIATITERRSNRRTAGKPTCCGSTRGRGGTVGARPGSYSDDERCANYFVVRCAPVGRGRVRGFARRQGSSPSGRRRGRPRAVFVVDIGLVAADHLDGAHGLRQVWPAVLQPTAPATSALPGAPNRTLVQRHLLRSSGGTRKR
jgi:hypothetical protein